jgi:hypothetical protein
MNGAKSAFHKLREYLINFSPDPGNDLNAGIMKHVCACFRKSAANQHRNTFLNQQANLLQWVDMRPSGFLTPDNGAILDVHEQDAFRAIQTG